MNDQEKTKNKGGRPPHKPTAETIKEVKALASFGVPQTEIAKYIGISHVTLEKYYRDILDTSAIKANSLVAQSLFKKTQGNGQGAVTACIFWLKARAGWKEVSQHEHHGALQINILPDDANL